MKENCISVQKTGKDNAQKREDSRYSWAHCNAKDGDKDVEYALHPPFDEAQSLSHNFAALDAFAEHGRLHRDYEQSEEYF